MEFYKVFLRKDFKSLLNIKKYIKHEKNIDISFGTNPYKDTTKRYIVWVKQKELYLIDKENPEKLMRKTL